MFADYKPAGWSPEVSASGTEVVEKNVPLNAVMKTPQFWLLSTTFAGMATGGMGLFAVAKQMMGEVFSEALPGTCSAVSPTPIRDINSL